MSGLPPPDFIECNPELIRSETIARYEQLTGKALQPAQVESLLVDLIAYEKTLTHVAVQEAAMQNLVAFARAPMLDHLGELVGVYRLQASSASALVRCAFATPLLSSVIIPVGTRFATASGVRFSSKNEAIAVTGSLFIDLQCVAEDSGVLANGFLAGQINTLVDDFGVDIASIANLGVTWGGADEEGDDRLRERIIAAPESFSVAGPRLAYVAAAKSAHQDILDVDVSGAEMTLVSGSLESLNDIPPGVVRISVLSNTGLPAQPLLDAVLFSCSDEKKRPLTDYVEVRPCVSFPYQITAKLTVYSNYDATSALQSARMSVGKYVALQQSRLGRDIVPSQIIHALKVDGVYDIELLSPKAIVRVPCNGWSNCSLVNITVSGEDDG